MTLEIVTPGGTRSVADCTSIRLYTSAGTPGWVGFRNGCARTGSGPFRRKSSGIP